MRVIVVGAGISGLSLAAHLQAGAARDGCDISLTILESGARPGGHAWTTRENGFVVEGGPNGFLDRERDPEPGELVRMLGLESRVIEANPAARRRFILRGGRLRRVPDGPATLLTSDVLSPAGKIRLMLEPWARKAPAGEESVFEFAERRIGHEAAEFLVDAAISGISAGDSRALSVGSAFPIMKEMERDHGSLIRAMIARRGTKPARLISFDGGMDVLIAALRERLAANLRTGAAVRSVVRDGAEWRVVLGDGTSLTADHVALAIPAYEAARITRDLDPRLARKLDSFPFSGLAVVALAYRNADTGPLDGYGYLVPRLEKQDTLGVLWESSVFTGRAPAGHALLRIMMGGARRPEVAELDQAELERRARAELARVMHIDATPLHSWVRRWPRAIAQYDFGHAERLREVRRMAAGHRGLELCGTSYDGISFGMAIASGAGTARRMLAAISSEAKRLEIA
ncbi:MAG TPA: protoporphyrinogen oxidase [Candidatus Krumholzibacteria bacterium]|nr:protoporphyrinogen oxidase [Candidatus Krumholzibacteria bacterium]